MFDKNKFAQIIKNIKETYISQEEFSKKSGIGRTYLSQYMNIKLDDPPKPKTLEKLAIASHGDVTYEQLMEICGYIDKNNSNDINNELISLYEKLSNIENIYENKQEELELTFKEEQVAHELFGQILKCLNEYQQTPDTFSPHEILEDIDFLSDTSKNKISNALQYDFEYFYYRNQVKKAIANLRYKNEKDSTLNIARVSPDISFYMCPVYGRISAGQPNWAEENIEGRIPVPMTGEINNPEECFYLKVNGESMNKVVKNGAYALIHKQDIVEDGEIAVVLVNGYDATLKKFSKQGDFVVLEPMSDVTNDPDIKTQIYDKHTSIKILGKYIGKFEMNK